MSRTYTVPHDITGSINDATGLVEFTFAAGSVTPKNDQDATALAYLAQQGLVAVGKPRAPKKETS